jgi:hypothetical protein
MTLTPPRGVLKFTGRNRLEAKRKALRFWRSHQELLNENMQGFAKHCTLSPDEKVITYRRWPTADPLR